MRTLVATAVILCVIPVAQAQQTIFNVPSADVTPQGRLFLQHESQFRPIGPDDYWYGTHYGAYGIGHNTELDVTLLNLSSPPSNNISLYLGFKSSLPVLSQTHPDREFKLTVGGGTPVSLEGGGVGTWGYSHLSGRLPKFNTRLTAGVTAGTENFFGRDTIAFIGGIEQPLTRRINLIADWYSGTHALGYLITGFSFTVSPSSSMYFGYQIPNSRQVSKSGFVFEWSKLF